MASTKELAASYAKRILEATNKQQEGLKVLAEINDLVWTNTQKPLTKEEKQSIVDDIASLISPIIRKSEVFDRVITEASDNSGILDVISMMKRGAK
jgi:hypothetical protein